MDVLPSDADSAINQMLVTEKPDVTYNDIGGLDIQVGGRGSAARRGFAFYLFGFLNRAVVLTAASLVFLFVGFAPLRSSILLLSLITIPFSLFV